MKKNKLISFVMILSTFLSACGGSNALTNGSSTTTPSTTPSSAPTFVPDVLLIGIPLISEDAGIIIFADSNTNDSNIIPVDGSSTTSINQELIVPMTHGDRALFNGVLFNGPAIARVTVEFHAQEQRCLIERTHDVALIRAAYNTDMATFQLTLSTQNRTNQILLNARDQDIARLTRLWDQSRNANNGPHIGEGLIWASGGLILGGLLVGGITALVR